MFVVGAAFLLLPQVCAGIHRELQGRQGWAACVAARLWQRLQGQQRSLGGQEAQPRESHDLWLVPPGKLARLCP
jgi:hypothetical protein